MLVTSSYINRLTAIAIVLFFPLLALCQEQTSPKPAYPKSETVLEITFDINTQKTLAPGSDNWAITWADDGHQYTTWGDGGGFGGTNSEGRVKMGVGRVEGNMNDYKGINVWGGHEPEHHWWIRWEILRHYLY